MSQVYEWSMKDEDLTPPGYMFFPGRTGILVLNGPVCRLRGKKLPCFSLTEKERQYVSCPFAFLCEPLLFLMK